MCAGFARGGFRMATEPQTDDSRLSALIRERIDTGQLPQILSKTISVGLGSGGKCIACDQPIENEQVEYQVFGPRYGKALRLHWGCHVLWQLECIERMRRQRTSDGLPGEPQP